MKSWKRPLARFGKLLLFLNGIAVISLLLSYLSPYINPKDFWPIAFAGLAYPFLLVINVLFILFWIFRKPKFVLISFLPLLLGIGALKKTIGFEGEIKGYTKDSTHLRIMSYNVHLFKGIGENSNKDTDKEIIKLINKHQPDILCIQKFYTRQEGKGNVKSTLIDSLGFTHHYFQEVAGNDFDAYGIAIFSKLPIVNKGALDINIQKKTVNRVQFVDIQQDTKLFRVYNVHLQSIGFQKEDYDFITTKPKSVEEELSSTRRIGSRLKNAFIKRSEQAKQLHDNIQQCAIPYVVAGDFNDTPLSYSVNKISRGIFNAFEEKGRGWGVTYNGAFPNFQIDYIMTSKDFIIHHFEVLPEQSSDHFPIVSDVKL